jgi:hypothetical protein
VIERVVLSFGVGAAGLSAVVFGLCALGMARTPWLVGAALVVLGAAASVGRTGRSEAVNRRWMWFAGAIAAPFIALYLANAAAPEISPDGSGYHLGLVRRYLNHGGFYRITTNMMANLTQGCEMLFLVAYSVGRHSAAALVHFLFLLALPAALIAYGRRFGLQTAGAIAALLVFVAPVAGIAGTSAYVDVALAFSGFATFYFLEIWNERREDTRLLLAAGLMAGFCFAIKYTGFVVVLFAAAYVFWKARNLARVAVLAAAVAVMAGPWLVKNWVVVDNPVSPFFNRLFPNPYIHIAMEDEYRKAMRNFNGAQLGAGTALDVTVGGGLVQGTIGPVFLLAPVGFAALRHPRGGRVLAAAALMALPWFANIGTRFLIPALPFIALAMGMAFADWPRTAMATVAINAVLCWPDVLERYCDPYAWRISRFPVKAALRIIPEREWVAANAPDVRFAHLLQDHVPAEGVVYTAQPIMEAYTDRTILLDYQAALNNRISDLLKTAIDPKLQPARRMTFRFEPRDIRGFRITATGASDNWTIHELEQPAPASVTAHPSPWYAPLAADGEMATAWRAWQRVRSGAFVEAATAETIRADSVIFRTRPNESGPPLRLELQSSTGEWTGVDSEAAAEDGIDPGSMRQGAIREIRRAGITHLLIHDQEPLGPDFQTHREEWQVRPAASALPVRLYEILPPDSIDTRVKLRNNTR